ncbi:PACE efflux transporter [Erwinia amylovora]
MKVELNKSPGERVFHAILFEVLANIIIAVSVTKLLGVTFMQSVSLSVCSAAAATLWGFIFNYFFDRTQCHYKFERTFKVRVIHTCLFEAGLIVMLLPVAMYLLDLTVIDALVVETGLVLFFLPYTLIFNWSYDHLRWQIIGKERNTPAM